MPHTRLPHEPTPQPPRTRSRFEDGAVDLHAGRVHPRPNGERAGSIEQRGEVAPVPVPVPAAGPATRRVDRVAAEEIAPSPPASTCSPPDRSREPFLPAGTG
ncbi:MAG TPA: hypothetical protein VHM02_14485, partial [Thermoanaerobaculia bacterium]|nr:hypothetical protein [Thermoanaerobaculia bacterium]